MTRRSRWGVSGVRSLAILFGGLALLLAAGDVQATDGPLPAPPIKDFTGRAACEVLRVPAGDLLVVRLDGVETTIRLIGTFVPKAGSDVDEGRVFLTRLLKGESVYVEYEPDWPLHDRKDHVWAYVYRAPDGLLVNLELVRQGYARLSAAAPFEHQDLLRTYECLARRNQKGVWSPEDTARAKPSATSQPAAAGPIVRSAEPPATTDDVIVYVTKSGKKYHRQDCQYVRGGAIRMTLEEAKAKGFTPCSRCKPPE